jgi:DNA-3-methyladenine glycosylase II
MPVDDLGIRKAVLQLEGRRALPDEGRVLARTEAYRPFRSIGAYYLWRTLDP